MNNLTGKRFGKLLVQRRVQHSIKKKIYWVCLCDCGKEKSCHGGRLKSGEVRSCGCIRNPVRHGMIKTRTYRSWCSMKSRVLNPRKGKQGEMYGKLQICDRWINSFEEFAKDMGIAPTEKHTIDRIENDKGYFPENCRWATYAEQNRNTSKNRNITINGKTQCIIDWATELGIPKSTLYDRLKRGLSVEEALGLASQECKSKTQLK